MRGYYQYGLTIFAPPVAFLPIKCEALANATQATSQTSRVRTQIAHVGPSSWTDADRTSCRPRHGVGSGGEPGR